MTAAVATTIARRTSNMKAHSGRPQILRFRRISDVSSLCRYAKSPGRGQAVPRLDRRREDASGGGKEARISERDSWYRPWPCMFEASVLIMLGARLPSHLLSGRVPVSRTAASLVARRINSGKLVRLPLASASLTASMLSLGGRGRFRVGCGIDRFAPSGPVAMEGLWLPLRACIVV